MYSYVTPYEHLILQFIGKFDLEVYSVHYPGLLL